MARVYRATWQPGISLPDLLSQWKPPYIANPHGEKLETMKNDVRAKTQRKEILISDVKLLNKSTIPNLESDIKKLREKIGKDFDTSRPGSHAELLRKKEELVKAIEQVKLDWPEIKLIDRVTADLKSELAKVKEARKLLDDNQVEDTSKISQLRDHSSDLRKRLYVVNYIDSTSTDDELDRKAAYCILSSIDFDRKNGVHTYAPSSQRRSRIAREQGLVNASYAVRAAKQAIITPILDPLLANLNDVEDKLKLFKLLEQLRSIEDKKHQHQRDINILSSDISLQRKNSSSIYSLALMLDREIKMNQIAACKNFLDQLEESVMAPSSSYGAGINPSQIAQCTSYHPQYPCHYYTSDYGR